MGVDSRKGPPLPAPTDTDSTTGVTEFGSKAAPSNQSEYLLPEDGSPVTIATRRRKHESPQSNLNANRSHTSLLIEYFEGGKGSSSEPRRPSVRVKVTPSSKGKSRSSGDHIQISESRTGRKSSHSKRGQSSNASAEIKRDESPQGSYASVTEGSNLTTQSDPIEVEIRPRRVSSPLIPTRDNTKYSQLTASEISSVPADSFLDGKSSVERSIERKRSQSLPRADTSGNGEKLKALTRQRSRSLSRERIVAQKAVEKVRRDKTERDRSERDKPERRRKHRSRSRSVSNSELYAEGVKSPRRKSSRSHYEDATASGPDLSLPNSQVSRGSDRYSVRSAGSKSSINNPKLLETVEDAIRRLILPELTALKREQSKHASRGRDYGGSVTSGSGVSRDSRDDESSSRRRLSERDAAAESLGKGKAVSGKTSANKLRKERNPREDPLYNDASEDRNRGLEAAVVGAGIGALTSAALDKHESQDSVSEKRERRRRRTKSRSRSDVTESHEDLEELAPPRMPLMSEVNASDLTRTSILSAETDRPNSASLEQNITPIREVTRGVVSPSLTTPVGTQKDLENQHIENAHGSLEGVMTEYELNEHGRKVPTTQSRDLGAGTEEHLEDRSNQISTDADLSTFHHYNQDYDDEELDYGHSYYQHQQEVPPPLRYIPYGHERRGLSPIQSVSGYGDDAESEQHHRDSRLTTHSTGSYSSLNKSAQNRDSGRSIRSLGSQGDVHGNHHDFPEVRQGGLADSELTQDGDLESGSYQGSEYKRMTNYTEDSSGAATTGQDVHGIGANPGYVGTPVAVESAVASLVNDSELTGYSANNDQYERRESYGSFEEDSERHFTSRGNSPTKHDTTRDIAGEEYGQEPLSQSNSPVKYAEEYDLDDQGRKVALPKTKKKGIAGIAANAAAVVLGRQRNKKKIDPDEIAYEERREDTGAPLQKSFKERAMEGQGHILSPRHSIDVPLSDVASHEQLNLGASGIPDLQDPMPEIGYGDNDSEVTTNPSIIQGPVGGGQEEATLRQPIDNPSTPTQAHDVRSGGGAVDPETSATRDGGQDEEWQRDSGDRKRDTLVTNPYEGTSPIAAIGGGILGESDYEGINHNFGPTKLDFQSGSPAALPKDEGYISSAPNALSPGALTPDPARGSGFLDHEIGDSMEDPFYTSSHSRHLSGMSHGMSSPMYDSATGTGIDRIQSKDIVALMDHLTVRDAQRSARDTELLVTLVRTAAEMRNSFEDVKRLLADTEDVIITEVQGNTENSIKRAINGPRPQPPSAPRSLRPSSNNDTLEDLPTKRRNIFRRALKGLSLKSANDLGRIEDMLEQLLGEVEGLKAEGLRVAQGSRNVLDGNGEYYDELEQEGNYEQDHGYEPEGNAGTSTASHASQSGHLSIPKSRGASATKGFDGRIFSDHRISTVHEGDEEELDEHQEEAPDNQYEGNQFEENQYENNQTLGTPVRDMAREMARAGSVPLGTPPQQQLPAASLSNENTPKTDKSKKHKSSSSSGWIPKVSRWSETTASSVFRGFRSSGRSSGRKDIDQFADPASRSGSDLGNFAEQPDAYGDDKLHSGYSQEQMQQYDEHGSPQSPVPPEDPKYKAHRNSLNLQHPQPRPGPTHRYQTQLESQAQDFNTPMTPKSLAWDSQTSLNRLPAQNTNRYSNGTNTDNLSPVSDAAYSNVMAGDEAPVRPPKIPELPPKIMASQVQKPSPLGNEPFSPNHTPYHNDGSGVYDEDTPRSASRQMSGALGVPARKPIGPRSMSSASRSGDLTRDEGTVRRNKNRDTFGSVASHYSGESEIF
ncbi:hypothetical protein B7463_g8527, partial [Scytalidium lignicola]